MYIVKNTIHKNLAIKQEDDKYKQNKRDFKVRHEEYIHTKDISKYAKHILDAQHKYGKIGDTTDILKIMPKGIDMDTWELFYTYKFSKE
jgi:hypothetical protein